MTKQPLVLLLLALIQGTQSYPSWTQCFLDLDESEVIMNHDVVPASRADHQVLVEIRQQHSEDDWKVDGITFGEGSTTFYARLRVPDELKNQDLQYLIETTEGASFVKPALCQGTRSHARSYDEAVEFQVDGTSDTVELWGGWATGHEQVRLTHRTILRKDGSEAEL